MKFSFRVVLFLFLILTVRSQSINAQCTWQSQIVDGFEYTTACPSILPNTTYHVIPQAYSVHSGAKSLYMNMQNCAGGVGVCAGDMFYRDTIEVCMNTDIRFSMWFTTTFSAPLSDVRVTVEDGNNVMLNNTASVVAPLSPSWIKYQSPTITPTTSVIYISLYTNVDGGNGNDLSMDDFTLEICSPVGLHSHTIKNICTNLSSVDLFNSIPGTPLITGTWSGPSTLTGGYLGTFVPAFNTGGTYIYNSAPFGIGAACPLAYDTVLAFPSVPPNPVLPHDTTICTNQFLVLNPATGAGNTYLWNTGSILQTIYATSGSLTIGDTVIYSVRVTNAQGCSATDSIQVIFEVCTSIDELSNHNNIEVYPNPAHHQISVKVANSNNTDFTLYNSIGEEVLKTNLKNDTSKLDLSNLKKGVYFYFLSNKNGVLGKGKLILTE